MYESSAFQDETAPHQQYNPLAQVGHTCRQQNLFHFQTRIESSLSGNFRCNCEREVKQGQALGALLHIQKMPRLVLQTVLSSRASELSTKTNIHFV